MARLTSHAAPAAPFPWHMALALSAAVAWLAWVGLQVPAYASLVQSPRAGLRSRPLAVFGIDAADWLVIDRLIAAGRLPTFARLKLAGATGVLEASPPLLSPIIWTTIATGREPEDHGVLDFMADLPAGGQAPVTAAARRTKAIWEIWSQAGRTVAITGWWATWPADEVRGVLVSDRISSPHLNKAAPPEIGVVYPAARWRELAAATVTADTIDARQLARFLPITEAEFDRAVAAARVSPARLFEDPLAHLRAALATARTYRAISTRLAGERPRLWAVYYELVDTASHLFIRDRVRGDKAIASAYEELDGALREAATALDPETVVVVLSDHGFQPADAGIREDPADLTSGATAWHRPRGIVAVATAAWLRNAPGNPAEARSDAAKGPGPMPIGTISPLDVVPSLLVCAGLPVARDMPGRVVPGLSCGAAEMAARVASYGAHDLPRLAAGTGPSAKTEMERLRALGYIAGASPTSLARVNLGEILHRKGDFRGAERELAAVLRADPLNERAALWLARTYVALDRPEEALRLYDRLIQAAATGSDRIDPIVFLAATDLDLARARLASAAARLGRVPAALDQAPEVLTARGTLAEGQARQEEAERYYRRALERAPSDVEPLRRLVDLLLGRGQVAAAAAVAGPAARAYPLSPMHLALAGEAAMAGRRYKESEALFESALALTPGSVSVRVELGRARLLAGRPDAALEALADVRDSFEADLVRGAALGQKNEWSAAVAAYERAAVGKPAGTDVLNALGSAQLRAGRVAEAVKTLERSLALKPDQPEVRRLLDEARKRGGK